MPLSDPALLLPAYECWMAGAYNQPAALCLWPNAERDAVSDKELEQLVHRCRALHFDTALVQRLGGTGLFKESFLNYLQRFRLECRIEQNTANSPLACISGPLIQVRLLKPLAMEMIEGEWIEENQSPHAIHL
jgi:nicotinic acid phosphoribosyltransferase